MVVSLFNDVIGPVMRGPSSSHCAAALRIGRLARDLMGGQLTDVSIMYDRHGSLATTHESQGSDMGLYGGLLGWDATDERLPDSARALRAAGVKVRSALVDTHDAHPNTYRISLGNGAECHTLIAISTGGGMISVEQIDAAVVRIAGDAWETLVWLSPTGDLDTESLANSLGADHVLRHADAGDTLLQITSQQPIEVAVLSGLPGEIRRVRRLAPVLPVLSRRGLTVPFTTAAGMFAYDRDRQSPLWRLALEYEAARGNLAEADVLGLMADRVRTLRHAVEKGLAGTDYEDRILGFQCGAFAEGLAAGHLLDAGMLNRIVLYVTALMEVKSSMGIIVAAPTAGACAALPGACLAAADHGGRSDAAASEAMLAGAIIGAFVAMHSTFAAEVCGCQAECGAASGMGAAALCTLGGGSARQCVAAASMALQNSLGMICDPVANRVEVPCLGKNVMAASNALSCANMALAGFDPVIPLDEVIETMDRVGRSLPRELRCTGLGGLSVTATAKAIEQRLRDRKAGVAGPRAVP